MKSIITTHINKIKEFVQSPIIIESVNEQNKRGTSLEMIKKTDTDWIEHKNDDLATQLQNNKTGALLKKLIFDNSTLYVESFLCDNQGAVVGEYPRTTDYWQGDEDKFIKSYNNGNGVVYIGPFEFDESSKTVGVQLSIPVEDTGKTIGVLVVGLKNIK
ncbi:MAG: hypothetical protein JW795_22540 [Chitinivibrionales bacterium]|nr:hypothetical protein [Chitinivibrionales bacterium]